MSEKGLLQRSHSTHLIFHSFYAWEHEHSIVCHKSQLSILTSLPERALPLIELEIQNTFCSRGSENPMKIV